MHEPSFSHKQSYMYLNLKDQNRSKGLVIKLKKEWFSILNELLQCACAGRVNTLVEYLLLQKERKLKKKKG